jgi:hypothetical protein
MLRKLHADPQTRGWVIALEVFLLLVGAAFALSLAAGEAALAFALALFVALPGGFFLGYALVAVARAYRPPTLVREGCVSYTQPPRYGPYARIPAYAPPADGERPYYGPPAYGPPYPPPVYPPPASRRAPYTAPGYGAGTRPYPPPDPPAYRPPSPVPAYSPAEWQALSPAERTRILNEEIERAARRAASNTGVHGV